MNLIKENFQQFKSILQQIKNMIEKSSQKKHLHALVKKYNGEYMLEIRAYGLPMGSSHGARELEDEFGEIIRFLQGKQWELAEVDEAMVSGKQFKYALFSFPQSNLRSKGDDEWDAINMDPGRSAPTGPTSGWAN